MKKTLLALAVVAASGAAFAQSATLSGFYFGGYQSTKVGGVTTAGVGTDTAVILLTATEDLGGGLKATAKVGLGGMSRGATVEGQDASLTLSGGFGSVTVGSVWTDDGLSSRAYGDLGPAYSGGLIILDKKVHGANALIDIVSYTSPQLAPGLTAGVAYVDRGTTGETGYGAGTTGAAAAQSAIVGNVEYKAGPINARFDVTSWARQGAADVASNTTKNRFRISGNYNLGMAKVGMGYSQLKRTTGISTTQLEAGVTAVVGAATVGVVYEQSKTTNAATKSGFTVGGNYNLSKRTLVNVGYATWKAAGSASDSQFRLGIGHAF